MKEWTLWIYMEFNTKIKNYKWNVRYEKYWCTCNVWFCFIGVFDNISMNKNKFVDKFDICQFFPGYLKHKEVWDRMKGGIFEINTLKSIFHSYVDKNRKIRFLIFRSDIMVDSPINGLGGKSQSAQRIVDWFLNNDCYVKFSLVEDGVLQKETK